MTKPQRTEIQRTIAARLVTDHPAVSPRGWRPLNVTFGYDTSDPLALVLRIPSSQGPVTWIVARDLLWDSLDGAVGIADVQAAPTDGNRLLVSLRSPSGACEITFPVDAVAEFLTATAALVPADGHELDDVDWDAFDWTASATA